MSIFRQPNGSPIKEVDAVKDLGVIMSDSAMFDIQVEDVVLKSSRQAGWIFRVLRTRAQLPMIILYRSLVKPHLEY